MRNRHLTSRLLVLTIAMLLIAAACGGDEDGAPTATAVPTTETPATATAVATATPDATATPADPTPDATTTPTQEPTPEPTTTPEATPPPPPPPPPYTGPVLAMRIPSLGVDAPIEGIGLVEGRNQLDVPSPHNIGWYDIYDEPGTGTSSLYSAHKDYWPDIRGPFYELTDLDYGDEIVVVMRDGREFVYEVFFHQRFTLEDIPMYDLIYPHDARNPILRRPPNEEWITLYTCGGDFVERTEEGAGYYLHRDVVIARLVDSRL